jgi:hypothetical protein
VARAISGIIFKILRGFLEICGLWVNIEQVQGLLYKGQEFLGFGIIFQWEKVVDLVNGPVDHAGVSGPRFHHELHSGRR